MLVFETPSHLSQANPLSHALKPLRFLPQNPDAASSEATAQRPHLEVVALSVSRSNIESYISV